MTTLPVRTISRISNFSNKAHSAFIFSVVPVASIVIESDEISTVLPRNTSAICKYFSALRNGAANLEKSQLTHDRLIVCVVFGVDDINQFIQL